MIVTAKLPPFARVGNQIDITVSSIGDAASLEGGVLLVTPLRAGDQSVYAVAQGPVSLGGLSDGSGKNFPTVGRVVSGATVEKDLEFNFATKKNFRLSLHNPDFTTSARVAATINGELGGKFATARDSGTIDVIVPFNYDMAYPFTNGEAIVVAEALPAINLILSPFVKVYDKIEFGYAVR